MEAGSEYLRKKKYKLSVKGRYYWTAATVPPTRRPLAAAFLRNTERSYQQLNINNAV
jgi:hypothetical protein